MKPRISALGWSPCREKITTRSNVKLGRGTEQTLTISSSVWNGTVASEYSGTSVRMKTACPMAMEGVCTEVARR